MMHVNVRKLVLGRRLANREFSEQKIGALEGVAVMGLDGLGSSAYGPEAALTILIPLGAASLSYIGWVMAPIVALLAILFASYWQTIRAYPSNRGAYIVAKENLGSNASLLAAAALMIDYVLNVSVGISAGVGALVSAVPELHPYILWLCLGILAIITLINLRGTQESGRVLAVPTYLFIASFAIILGLGTYKALAAGGQPQPVVPPPGLPQATEAVSVWLLLRAFASGCTAMTGVEAVSNGMGAFREPAVKHGHRTLTAIVVILGLLLIAIAHLATAYGIGAMDQTQGATKACCRSLSAQLSAEALFTTSRSAACFVFSRYLPTQALSDFRVSAGPSPKTASCRGRSPLPAVASSSPSASFISPPAPARCSSFSMALPTISFRSLRSALF